MNSTAALVKRGRTYDYEDSRTTNRMHAMLGVLKGFGIEPTITHGTRTYFDSARAGWLTSEVHLCSLNGSGYQDCTIEWPAWVTDNIFDLAWRLADAVITEQGAYNRAAAAREYAAR